jgi:hypothetical protein
MQKLIGEIEVKATDEEIRLEAKDGETENALLREATEMAGRGRGSREPAETGDAARGGGCAKNPAISVRDRAR